MPADTNREEKEKVWFRETRHVENIQGASLEALKHKDDWRRICERMKTVSVALVLCLNIGTDPPDVQKPQPCARKEAWVDPAEPGVAHAQQRPAQRIAQSLQKIYEKLHPRARYKSAIDPTVDCVRKLCMSMRRNAKNERVLFHFNGHGVPKPSEAGEIWLFNHDITQYIPLSLYELQSWMGTPSVYLWDCNSAGTIINMFMRFAEDHSIRWMEEYREMRDRDQLQQQHQSVSAGTSVADSAAVAAGIAAAFGGNANALHNNNDTASSTSTNSHSTIPSYKNCIHLGACSSGEQLPFHNADLPADLFTCCLTSPIQTSLLCHMLKTGTKNRFPPSIIDEIPGVLSDRRTLLGELNWIFTAITDAIAWCRLPRSTFQKLFRQDLLIASLFRAFLLSERIMRENGCHVVSTPQLPPVHDHPLWEYWDYTLDMCLTNLYNLLQPKQGYIQFTRSDCFVATPTLKHHLLIDLSLSAHANEYAYSWFFVEQLQAFEVWLKFGVDKCEPPQQLPVVLQVLLSVNHRLRALDLLARFIDMGPWAVLSALSVGIFPYVHRLLQCPTPEVRPALAFIWAKILAIDPGCQHELVKDNGYDYFLQVLNDQSVSPRMKIISAFVMATFIYKNYRPAQEKLVQSDYVTLCIELLSSELVTRCRMLVLWLLIGLGRLWAEYDKARWQAIRSVAYDKVVEFLNDDLPEVRAAAVFALGCFVHNTSRNNEHATAVENEVCDKLCEKCTYDGSVLVRAELAAAIQWFVIDFQSRFATICAELDRRVATQSPSSMMMIGNGTVQHGQELSKAMAAMCLSPTESELLLSDTASTASAVPPGADHHHHSQWPASSSSAFSTLPRRKISSRSGGGAFGTTNHHGVQPHQQQRQAPPAPSQGRRAAPANSSSASIYAILPRSASSIIPNPANIRRRFSPIRKMSSILAGPSTASAAPTSPSGETAGLNSNSLFKFRVLSHIRSLESKTFIGPFERIWLCVLRLGLDPFDGVATMGEQIIRYIFELSSKIKESRDKALELKQSTGGRPISVNGPIMMNSGASGSQQISPADVQKHQQSHSHPEKVKFLVGTPQGVGTTTPMPSAVTPTNNIGTVVVPSGGGDVRSIGNSTPPPLVPIITTLPDGDGAVAATHPPPTPIAEEPPPTGSSSTATTDPVAMMLARRCAPSPMRTPPTSTSSGAAATAIAIGTLQCPGGTTITTAEEENDDQQQQQATATSSASSTPSAAQQQQTSLNKKHPEMDNAKRRLLLDPFIHQSLYTPKRSIFGTQAGAYSQVADSNELLLAEQSATVAVEGLVRTSFVEWCAKTWTEPIYDTIYGLGRGIPTRNSLVDGASPFTMAQPTDWAIHTHEGIRQRAKKELEVLKTKHFRCETQIMQLKLDRPATSMAWSFLRPYVYIGDGERVRIYSYSTGDEYRQQQQHHHQYGADTSPQIPQPPPSSTLCSEFWAGSEPFLQDQITDLMVVNELTHELLMSGTRNGLLRVWDPMFHEHSHELLERPKLVTATYMLNDVPRVSGGQNRIIYHWDQRGGRLVCAGNVRICRVWDAWAERAVFDVTLKHAKGAVVAVGSELRFDLVSCGFSDGTVALFDIRVPAKGCEVLHLRDSNAPVVGMAMLGGDEQRERLLVGTRDGEIRLWEPRMFKEALVEFNVNRVQHRDGGDAGARSGGYFGGSSSTATFVDGQHRMMQQMEVQVQGELIACAMDDATVFLFDIDGRGGALSRLRWPTASGGAGRALLSAAASSFYSPTGAMSGISSLLWGRPRRNSSGGTSVTSGSGADNGSSSVSVFGDHHFTSPQRRQQQQTGAAGPPSPAAMRFHKQRVLLGLATAEGQFRAYAMPSSVDSGVSSNSTSGGAEDVLGTGAGGMASAVLRRI